MKIGRSSTLQSTKYLQKRKKKKIFLLIITIIASLIVFILIIFSFKFSFLRINNININGAQTVSSEDIKFTILEQLSGNYIGIIPRNSFFFISEMRLEKILYEKFKKIHSIDIKTKGLTSLNVNITERDPSVIICEGYRDDEENESCFFTDENGIKFEKISDLRERVYFRYYSSTEIEKTKFLELQRFIKNVENLDIEATGLLVSEDGSYELYIKNVDQSIAVVYFDDRTEFDKTLSNLSIFWKNSLNKKIDEGNIPNFEYINLRFGNNIFYRIK